MEIPNQILTAEDIQTSWALAQVTIKEWDNVRSSTNASEYTAYRERLSTAHHGVASILSELEKQAGLLKNKIGSVKLLMKDLERHEAMAKNRYWEYRQ